MLSFIWYYHLLANLYSLLWYSVFSAYEFSPPPASIFFFLFITTLISIIFLRPQHAPRPLFLTLSRCDRMIELPLVWPLLLALLLAHWASIFPRPVFPAFELGKIFKFPHYRGLLAAVRQQPRSSHCKRLIGQAGTVLLQLAKHLETLWLRNQLEVQQHFFSYLRACGRLGLCVQDIYDNFFML